jgi:3-dehydroquinate synthase
MDEPRTIRIDLGPRSYDVRIGSRLLDGLGQWLGELGCRRAAIITESNVGPLYGDAAESSLRDANIEASRITFPAGEANKTLPTASAVLDEMLALAPPIDRGTWVLALGGGVAGDLAGFAAAVALRGLKWLQCPTSLLADVDASVGGKTGVDHAAGKNLIGAFHQPSGVLIDVETLRSLDRAELINGLAECVKHAVIRDADLLGWIEDHAEQLLARDGGRGAFPADVMTELVARNVAIKAAVVAEDEREAGVRAHLNFGHSIGHAVETTVGYDVLRHGEAVSLGMVAEAHIAVLRGLWNVDERVRIESALQALDLPTRREGLDADRILPVLAHDKKNLGGRVRMVLPSAIGQVDIYDDVTEAELRSAIEELDPNAHGA